MATQLALDYPDTFALLGLHHSDAFATPWGNARFSYYSPIFAGYPTFVYDGLSDNWPTSVYEANFLSRQAIPTDVTLSVSATQIQDEAFEISTEVCIEPDGTGKSLRIHLVQSLETYPDARAYARNTVMQGVAGIDVTVAAGACETVVHPITFDAASWARYEQIQLTVIAQEPVAAAPAEVHQATQITWPFNNDAIFADGFESGDTGGWSSGT